jgi:hypothetical protein
MKFLLITICILFLTALPEAGKVAAQTDPDPAGAFVRSLAVPGWGHFYAGNDHRTRGAVHLGTDLVLIGTLFGFNARAVNLREQYTTLSSLRAGVDISGRERSFRLAVGDFNSLEAYNDYQLRTRNWDRLIEDTPDNRWLWDSADDRIRYRELRSTRDRIRNQLPALAALMVVNRVVSGISAYNRARGEGDSSNRGLSMIGVMPVQDRNTITGSVAVITFSF